MANSLAIADAYGRAMADRITPGMTVLDLGEDSGLRPIVACALGAARVLVLQPADRVAVLREAAAVNRCEDRVVCLGSLSDLSEMDVRADLVVARLPAAVPIHGESLLDATREGGSSRVADAITIPSAETLRMAVVEDAAQYGYHVRPWEAEIDGLDLRDGRVMALQTMSTASVRSCQWLVEPAVWSELSYDRAPDRLAGRLERPIVRAGVAHGIAVWTRANLSPTVAVDDEPSDGPAILGHAFFPWPEPVAVQPNDTVSVDLRMDVMDGAPIWTWTSRVVRPGRSVRAFRQSTFAADFDILREMRLRRAAG